MVYFHPLINKNDSSSIPLQSVQVEFESNDLVYQLKMIQQFRNTGSSTIQASYRFPLENDLSVGDFEFEMSGKVFKGEVFEKEEAKRQYQNAISAGKTASKMDSESTEIFQIDVGNIPPETSVIVRITCIGLVKVEKGTLRLSFPTAIAPRYGETVSSSTQQSSNPSSGYKISGVCRYPERFVKAECPSHGAAEIRFSDDRKTANFSLNINSPLNRDIVLELTPENSTTSKPRVYVHRFDEQNAVAMVNYVPNFSQRSSQDCKDLLYFVVDRSGSMEDEGKMTSMIKALRLAINSIVSNQVSVNIIGFGSHFTPLWNQPQLLTEKTRKEALNYIDNLRADFGGTELFSPINHIVNSTSSSERFVQMIVLTDGEIDESQMQRIFALVESNKNRIRVSSVGMGRNVSHKLIREIANHGQGLSVFLDNQAMGNKFEEKMVNLIEQCTSPATSLVNVHWEGVSDITQTTRPFFNQTDFAYFAILKSNGVPNTVRITASSCDGSTLLEYNVERESLKNGSEIIPKLTARAIISDLEHDANSKERIKQMSLTFQVMSKYTSYLAIDPTTRTTITQTKPVYFNENDVHFSYNGIFPQSVSVNRCCAFSSAPPPPMAPGGGNSYYASCASSMAFNGPASMDKSKCKSMDLKYDMDEEESCEESFSLFGRDDEDEDCDYGDEFSSYSYTPSRSKSVKESAPIFKRSAEKCFDRGDVRDTSDDDILDRLFRIQQNGYWSYNSSIESELCSKMNIKSSVRPNNVSSDYWMTTLAIVYLETQLHHARNKWKLVVEKAYIWLKTQKSSVPYSNIKTLIESH